MSASDLLRRLDEAATPGPWSESGGMVTGEADADVMLVDGFVAETPRTISADARLIATLRTLLPELRAVVEAVVRPGVEGGIECGICLASWDPHGSGRGAKSEWHHDYCTLRALDARAAELGGTDG